MSTNNPITAQELLKNFPLFRDLSLEETKALVSAAEYRLVGTNTKVVSHGAVGETLFLIRSGRVNLQISGEVIDTRTNGQVIGEESLFAEAAMRLSHYKAKVSSSLMRTADAVTASACEFVLLSHELLVVLLDSNANFFKTLQTAGTKTTLQHGYLGSEEAKAIIRQHTVAPPGQELVWDYPTKQVHVKKKKGLAAMMAPVQEGFDGLLNFFTCAASTNKTIANPSDRHDDGEDEMAKMEYKLQSFRGNYSGIQVLSTAEADRYQRDTSKWLAFTQKERPPAMEQPLSPDLLHKAAFLGDMMGVQSILAGPDGAIRTLSADRYGRTALHLAAVKGHHQICAVLLNVWSTKEGKHRLAKITTKDGLSAADVAVTQGYESIVQLLMIHQFGVASSVLAALESRYQIRKKKGSVFILYEMLAIDDKIEKRFGLTAAELLSKLDQYGLSWHSMADTHKLYEHLMEEGERGGGLPTESIRDGRIIFQCHAAKELRALENGGLNAEFD